jgi:hypothetical protein
VSPVYALESWLSGLLGTQHEAPVLAVLFALLLVVEPLLLLGLAAHATRLLTAERATLLAVVTRYAPSLAPLGFAVWLAHYGFHFLTGLFTLGPVVHGALLDLGLPLGPVRHGTPGLPEGLVYPLELGFLTLGALGSCLVAERIAARSQPAHSLRGSAPFALLALLLAASAAWLLSQPMEMRGTFLGG